MKKILILQGVAGSGKSTLARKLNKNNDYLIISSDEIRKMIIDVYIGKENNIYHQFDMNIPDNTKNFIEKQVWTIFKFMVTKAMQCNLDIILDATFTQFWMYRDYIMLAQKYAYYKIGYSVIPSIETILSQNEARDRKVPIDVIKHMYSNFEMFDPQIFDEIITIE